MKKETYTTVLRDVSLEEAFYKFISQCSILDSKVNCLDKARKYLTNNYYGVSEEEKKEFVSRVDSYYDDNIGSLREYYRNVEKEKLKDRESILKFLSNIESDFSEVGYLLSPEEILNEILKNGKK